MSGMTLSDIPDEILLYIFSLASVTPSTGPPRWQTSTGKIPVNLAPKPIVEQTTAYRPFSIHPFSVRSNEWACTVQESLDTKRTIVLVCKEWMRLGVEILYEAIRIDHGSEALFNALSRGSETQLTDSNTAVTGFELAKWVKRAEVTSIMVDIDPFNPSLLWRILRSCPNLATIVIPDLNGVPLGRARWADENERFALSGPSASPAFPNLKMIECNIPQTSGYYKTVGNPNGVMHNFSGLLEQLLDHAPNLQHITLSGGCPKPEAHMRQISTNPKVYNLGSLTSLRVEAAINALFSAKPSLILQFPNLSRIIVGGALGAILPVLEVCGSQITTLEVLNSNVTGSRRWTHNTEGRHKKTIGHLLEMCPNLQDLNFDIAIGEVRLNQQDISYTILPRLERIHIRYERDLLPESANFGTYMEMVGDFFVNQLEANDLETLILSGHGGKDGEWKWQRLVERIKGCRSKYERVRVEMAQS